MAPVSDYRALYENAVGALDVRNTQIAALEAEVAALKTENACLWASRPFWIFSVREDIRRGDVEAVRARGLKSEQFVAERFAERDEMATTLRQAVEALEHVKKSPLWVDEAEVSAAIAAARKVVP